MAYKPTKPLPMLKIWAADTMHNLINAAKGSEKPPIRLLSDIIGTASSRVNGSEPNRGFSLPLAGLPNYCMCISATQAAILGSEPN